MVTLIEITWEFQSSKTKSLIPFSSVWFFFRVTKLITHLKACFYRGVPFASDDDMV